jgi:hypothetical protein
MISDLNELLKLHLDPTFISTPEALAEYELQSLPRRLLRRRWARRQVRFERIANMFGKRR